MIGRVEETSASFEARSAPRLYPTSNLRRFQPTALVENQGLPELPDAVGQAEPNMSLVAELRVT